jgi:hypothetical protein
MKKVFKLLVLSSVLIYSSKSIAQTFGVKGGLNLTNMVVKADSKTLSEDFKMNPGFHLGATAEFPINDMFAFESGLLISTKGYKIVDEEGDYKSEGKLNLTYLDIPLTAKASFEAGSAKIFGLFGPYVGLGLTGKSKYTVTSDDEKETEEEDVKWGSDKEKSDFKRLDYGLSIGAGLEINSLTFGLNYNLGMANIIPNTVVTANNRVIAVSVGYKFGK